MATSLNAHIEAEKHTKEFLKDTISDISHQLKTPLAALKMYNEIVQEESDNEDVVTWKETPAITKIIVKDNGKGIHPEDIHHIFKRFYRSRFSQDTQGLGLGLSFKTIIEAHNGTITVDSTLGKGSVFILDFLKLTNL